MIPKPWRWRILAATLAAIAAGVVTWRMTDRPLSTAEIIARLPREQRIVGYVNVRALRVSGVLDRISRPAGKEEPDYAQFVKDTGFDYKRDLDAVALSQAPSDSGFVATGRFDWRKLQSYAKSQGGGCDGDVCRSPGSQGREIHFSRLNSRTLAITSGSGRGMIDSMRAHPSQVTPAVPAAPVWIDIPTSRLKEPGLLPAGTRMFATAVSQADRVMISLGPSGDRFEAALEAHFEAVEQSAQALIEMKAAMTLLNKMIRLENKQPDPKDLTGVLTKGDFRVEGTKLVAIWPLERVFFESLGAGE